MLVSGKTFLFYNLLSLLFFGLSSFVQGSFKEECLDAHNKFRRKHGVPLLQLDEDIQKFAQAHANTLAMADKFKHSQDMVKFGENIYVSNGAVPNAEQAVWYWYGEIKDYNFKNPSFSYRTGHFTQVIWKQTRRLGCAYAKNNGKVYIVANYEPPGNMMLTFSENVRSSARNKSVWNLFHLFGWIFIVHTSTQQRPLFGTVC